LPDLVVEPLSRARLALYAGASGDHVPLHIDTDVARRAGMPDVFGHGMLCAAWLGRLLTSWVEQERIRSIELRFVGIFHLYNEAVCSGRVVERMELNGEPCVRVDVQLKNQYGEQKVTGVAVVALP
jgi:acyl dehydratase